MIGLSHLLMRDSIISIKLEARHVWQIQIQDHTVKAAGSNLFKALRQPEPTATVAISW